ncbi:MAG TPA: outer membrane protein transport protein [Rhodothermales bacterium]|nr:outer membrane protein transport protein [Rhodothermales bacterium]
MHKKNTQGTIMGRLRWLAMGLLVAAVGVQPASAQTAEDAIRFTDRSPATGVRMMGMAGAGIVGVADYSALFSNPAGLGFFRSSSASGALQSVYTTDESFYSTPGNESFLDSDATSTQFGNLAYVYRAPTRRGSFVIAAAFNQINTYERELRFEGNNSTSTISTSFLPFDGEYGLTNSDELDFLDDLPFAAFNGGFFDYFPDRLPDYPFLEAVVPGTTIQQSGTVTEEGRMSELSFGGALEAAPRVMVGLSANIAFGTYEFNSLFAEDDIFDENGLADYSVLLDDGTLFEGFDFLEYEQRLQSDLLGVNLRLGLSAQAASNLRVGLTLETPTYYTVNEDYGASYLTGFDDGNTLSYGDDFDDVGNGEFEYEIQTPWRLGVGVGFNAENVFVTGDVEYVDWSQLELDAETDRSFFADLNRGIEEAYEPVINTRLGIEYRLGDLSLRGGFAYRPDPLDTAPLRSDGSELERDKTFFSAGFGYRFQRQFQVDFGWMQGRFDSAYSAYPEDSVGARQDDILLIDEEVVQNQFSVGVSFFF